MSSQELNTNGGSAALGSRGPTLRKENEERDRLAALVKLQGRELDAIKAEINLLRLDGCCSLFGQTLHVCSRVDKLKGSLNDPLFCFRVILGAPLRAHASTRQNTPMSQYVLAPHSH